MKATDAGAFGLHCLRRAQYWRGKNKNLNGAVSGRIRRNIDRAVATINTLTHKAGALGDLDHLRMRNKELSSQVEKLKACDVLRNRKMEEIRNRMAELRKEVSELRDKLDEVKEENRKDKDSQRRADWKARNAAMEAGTVNEEEPTSANIGGNLPECGVFDRPPSEILPSDPTERGPGPSAEDPGSSSVVEPVYKEMKGRVTVGGLSKQVKELVRMRAFLTKKKLRIAKRAVISKGIRGRPCLNASPKLNQRWF